MSKKNEIFFSVFLYFYIKQEMNANVYMCDVNILHYMKRFGDLKNWMLNTYSVNVSYSKKNKSYYINREQITLSNLLERIKEEFNFVSYESHRRNTLYTCCNVTYGFEKYLHHLSQNHKLDIYVLNNKEKLFCNECEFCSIKPEELEAHFHVHHLPDDTNQNMFHLCQVCMNNFEIHTFHKTNPLAIRLYIEHLNLHYFDLHEVKQTNEKFECTCGFVGSLDDAIVHYAYKSKVEVNPLSITIKSDPELRDEKCSICLEEYSDVVYKCLWCKNGFCFHKCASEVLRNEKDCPMCRKKNF